jgi:hypothetical protein
LARVELIDLKGGKIISSFGNCINHRFFLLNFVQFLLKISFDSEHIWLKIFWKWQLG